MTQRLPFRAVMVTQLMRARSRRFPSNNTMSFARPSGWPVGTRFALASSPSHPDPRLRVAGFMEVRTHKTVLYWTEPKSATLDGRCKSPRLKLQIVWNLPR